jgi:hypothetical protein
VIRGVPRIEDAKSVGKTGWLRRGRLIRRPRLREAGILREQEGDEGLRGGLGLVVGQAWARSFASMNA